MSVRPRPAAPPAPSAGGPPAPLRDGERLTQPEFHRRYEAMPGAAKFELVGGVVRMASPVHGRHSTRLHKLIGAFTLYESVTPGVEGRTDGTVVLDARGEPRPDIALRILPEHGGRTRTDPDGCIVGGPELVVEVADSTEALDLGPKRDDYRRAGVLEYVVVCLESGRFRAFDLPADAERDADADGIWRSGAFPGLWIDAGAAMAGDAARLLDAVRRGTQTPQHADFVRSLAAAARTPPT